MKYVRQEFQAYVEVYLLVREFTLLSRDLSTPALSLSTIVQVIITNCESSKIKLLKNGGIQSKRLITSGSLYTP